MASARAIERKEYIGLEFPPRDYRRLGAVFPGLSRLLRGPVTLFAERLLPLGIKTPRGDHHGSSNQSGFQKPGWKRHDFNCAAESRTGSRALVPDLCATIGFSNKLQALDAAGRDLHPPATRCAGKLNPAIRVSMERSPVR
jgi:hypothetical protein